METMTYRSAEGLVSVDSSPCTLKCKSLSMFDRIVLSPIAKNEQTISHEHNDKRKNYFLKHKHEYLYLLTSNNFGVD